MPTPRHDDPAIDGNILLYRRIPPWKDNVTWDDAGVPSPASQNFKDPREDELSLHIASETTPDRMLAGHPGFGLVAIRADELRAKLGSAFVICRDDIDPSDGHVLVCGRITNGMAKGIKKIAHWVPGHEPDRNPPPPPTT